VPAGFPAAASEKPLAVVLCEIIVVAQLAGWAIKTALLIAEHRHLRAWRGRAERITTGPIAEIARDACRRAGLARLPEILVSSETGVPCAFGVRRTAICLPARLADAMSRDHLSLVLLHEALHLRRRDPLANIFDAALASFWWFHPGARLLASARRKIREERCDEAVLRARPGASAPYSRALVAAAAFAARRPARTLSTAVSDGPEHLASRIRALAPLRDTRRRRVLPALVVAAAALVLLPGVRPEGGHPSQVHPAGSVRP
jgi:beta-lactamase regulating signal transducer with metallopeptidase domain